MGPWFPRVIEKLDYMDNDYSGHTTACILALLGDVKIHNAFAQQYRKIHKKS